MSGRFSLNAWNDWRWVERGIVDVTVLRANFDYLRAQWVSVDFVLLGFGFSLTYYFAHNSAVIWEPIELDGYTGEPQGREHAP